MKTVVGFIWILLIILLNNLNGFTPFKTVLTNSIPQVLNPSTHRLALIILSVKNHWHTCRMKILFLVTYTYIISQVSVLFCVQICLWFFQLAFYAGAHYCLSLKLIFLRWVSYSWHFMCSITYDKLYLNLRLYNITVNSNFTSKCQTIKSANNIICEK